METLESIITEHPFFEGFKPHHIKLLVGCASNVRFNPGEFLLRGGEEANQFFVLRQGKVAIELSAPGRKPIMIQMLEGGEIIGWSWLVPPYQWRFNGRAIELTRAIAFDGKCLRTKCEEDHDLGFELLKRFTTVITRRLDAASLQLLDTYGEHS